MSMYLLNEINNNYQMAVAVHRELADVFWFIYLPGYALWNEYQYLDESFTQRKIKRYITSTYHTFVPDKLPKSANIAEPLLSGKNRKQLKTEETYKILRELFRIYSEWEESALKGYEKIVAEILANGDVAAFNFASEIIKDVKAELVYVTDKVIELNAHDWDLSQVAAEQNDYVERFERLIREMMGKSRYYHHHNSALDPEARAALLDKYPD